MIYVMLIEQTGPVGELGRGAGVVDRAVSQSGRKRNQVDGVMAQYHIIGKRGAGSLIAEFLLVEAGQPYDITFMELTDIQSPAFRQVNPLGKIPLLRCPDGTEIAETMAIVAYLIETYPQLAPDSGTPARACHWQYLAMLATGIYPAYHRQHHTHYYVDEAGFVDVKARAKAEQAPLYDYIEGLLHPYLCGDTVTAADFYLYMLTRWDLDRAGLRNGRPKLTAFMELMRAHDSVARVIANQKRS